MKRLVVHGAAEAAVTIHAAGGAVSDTSVFCGLPRKICISLLDMLKIYSHR